MGYSFLIMRQLHRLKPAAKGTKAQRDKVTKGKGKRRRHKTFILSPFSFICFVPLFWHGSETKMVPTDHKVLETQTQVFKLAARCLFVKRKGENPRVDSGPEILAKGAVSRP
jgi:hypothetical protein